MKILINFSIIISILLLLLLIVMRETNALDNKIMKLRGIETSKVGLVNQNFPTSLMSLLENK